MPAPRKHPAPKLTKLGKTFVRRLVAIRTERGFSQAELSQKSGVAQAFISRLELGHSEPSLTTLESLAKALAVPASDLLSA